MNNNFVKKHYDLFPYPSYPFFSKPEESDLYCLRTDVLFNFFNGFGLKKTKILLAGCGTFSPFVTSLANKKADITALDISNKTLFWAKLKCAFFGCRNITFRCDDIESLKPLNDAKFDFIDSYGVLHHLKSTVNGLNILSNQLNDHGLLRIMVYSSHARKKTESIRKAFKILKISRISEIKKIFSKARKKEKSLFKEFFENNYECTFDSGIADALLHPQVKTFKINEFVELINKTDLKILKFIHSGALSEVDQEISRLKILEKNNKLENNFACILGKRNYSRNFKIRSWIINPMIKKELEKFSTKILPNKFGVEPPILDLKAKTILQNYINPKEDCSRYNSNFISTCKESLVLIPYEISPAID